MDTPLVIDSRWPAEGSLAWNLLHFPQTTIPSRKRKGDLRLKVLHLLSQQPGRTGSGIYLQAIVRYGAQAGFDQRVIAGIPSDCPVPAIFPLPEEHIRPVRFGTTSLPFPIPGMSDVMPYESTRFSSFTAGMLDRYLQSFHDALSKAFEKFEPDIIHTHHLWLATALTRTLFTEIPIVTTCHGTDLRQIKLAPSLASFVIPACSQVDKVLALHEDHVNLIHSHYGIGKKRISLVNAGYRDDLFHPPDTTLQNNSSKETLTLAYVGKISRAKGLPWLIEAMDMLEIPKGKKARLLVIGSVGGEEGLQIRRDAEVKGDRISFVGSMPQEELGGMLRDSDIFVLPSFYEGLPLVVLEALACCCRVVVTHLPGMSSWLPDRLVENGIVELVPLPRLIGPDVPEPSDLPQFTANLADAISGQLQRCVSERPNWSEAVLPLIAGMTWQGIFKKVEKEYYDVLI